MRRVYVYRVDDDNAMEGEVFVAGYREACRYAQDVAEAGHSSTVTRLGVELPGGREGLRMFCNMLNRESFAASQVDLVTYEARQRNGRTCVKRVKHVAKPEEA